tara:strand:- start:958 stop:1527 length:570 start_codon:yes stop_codon:yes gene_type:complete
MKSINKDLSKRFIEGIKNYNLTLKKIESDGWGYCGGSNDIKRFHQYFPKQELLPHKDNCVCGHDIINNCYITNNFKKFDLNCILILGSCCVKKFIPEGKKKRCINCNESHQNRKDNICNDCREDDEYFMIASEWQINFGKHKGLLYSEVPMSYLRYLYNIGRWEQHRIKDYRDAKVKRYIEYRINQSNQ